MGYQEAIQQIARSKALTDGDRVVFLELLGRLDFNNYVLVNVSDIAKDMNRTRESVSRSIKRLADNGILHKGPKNGTNYSYILDPWTAWRGKVEEKSRVQREVSDRKWKVLDGGSKESKKKA